MSTSDTECVGIPEVTVPEAARKAVKGVVAHLCLSDAAAASAFYQKAFGAEELQSMPAQDGKRVMHCCLGINGGAVMLNDAFPEFGHAYVPPQGYVLHLQVEDLDRWWARAVEAGAEVVMPAQPMFWGDRYGQLRDPFGVTWSLAETIKK